MQNENIQVDQLEDQIIDHPDLSTQEELLNESLDETFQRKLNAKAEQINRGELLFDQQFEKESSEGGSSNDPNNVNFQFLITKSHLNYDYKDYGNLEKEISEWFTGGDLIKIGLNNLINYYDANTTELNQLVSQIEENELDNISVILKIVLYYAFGEYANKKTKEEQIEQIKINVNHLLKLSIYKPLVTKLIRFFNDRIEIDKSSDGAKMSNSTESNYFKILTLLYFLTLIALDNKDTKFRGYIIECELLNHLIKFLEHWKWYKNQSYRVRYLILIVNKLIFIEFGDSNHLKSCDEFLIKLYDIKNKKGKDEQSTLTCSPLDYFAFREDLLDKYPMFNINPVDFNKYKQSQEEIDQQGDKFMAFNSFSNSLSNLIQKATTIKSHTILKELPGVELHISTPLPSPTLMNSDYMTGGEKIRKSYQVNQSLPFIFPNDQINNCVPKSIKEADEIYRKSIYESYSIKRLWNERENFMQQERGYIAENTTNESDYDFKKLYKEYPTAKAQISSIERVEFFYSSNLSRLHTIIEIFMEIMISNRIEINLHHTQSELNPVSSIIKDKVTKTKVEEVLFAQLEVINVKEITLKASINIILMLLKWFKINHVLKYYYFSSLLFDQKFFNISLEYLSRCFNNSNIQNVSNKNDDNSDLIEYEILINQNKLMNPKINLPRRNFFNNCLNKFSDSYEYKFINDKLISKLPEKLDSNNINHRTINQFNDNFVFILINILNIINKILIKNQSQRIFALNDLKPSEIYKMILINYDNESITPIILKTLKKLVPYQGRKWKSVNMDLISQIYLTLKLDLKDNWLSGKDLESDFNSCYDQEIALRGLIQFYNMRKYKDEMKKIGYKLEDMNNEPLQFKLDDDDDINDNFNDLSIDKMEF
ncbi:unnamed protein product [Candida verbasci]|uniref:Factor arrest protein 11 n=1 Tax=Candida verbasci TaxID=1227364 RepID=A0A9W4U078_9ASCO|nr:unnamed protein product [Candida verbasci]